MLKNSTSIAAQQIHNQVNNVGKGFAVVLVGFAFLVLSYGMHMANSVVLLTDFH